VNFNQLKTFIWVAKLGGFRKAAETHHTSQPAISARIAGLEEYLGVELLDRERGGGALTRKGQELYGYAEQLLDLVSTIEQKIGDPKEYEAVLRIGVSETIVQSWLSKFLAHLSDVFPKVDVELTVDVSVNLRDALTTRSIDLAFLMGPVSAFSIENVELPDVELAWYGSSENSLGDLKSDQRAFFLANPILTYARNTRPFMELKAELSKRYGAQVRIFSSSSLSACLQMLSDNVGIGAMPIILATKLEKEGKVVKLPIDWCPQALNFTASFESNTSNWLPKEAALLAQNIAKEYMIDQ
jgi:DNA-binding transcriptional LysR family regulator